MSAVFVVFCCLHLPANDIGTKTLTGKKFQRTYVQRVLMGPPAMFTASILEEENVAVNDSQKLSIWALFMQKGNELNVPQFLDSLGKQHDDIVVGTLSDQLPVDLVNAGPWTIPDLLTLDRKLEVRF